MGQFSVTINNSLPGACPPVVECSQAEQARIAEEVAGLPEGALILTLFRPSFFAAQPGGLGLRQMGQGCGRCPQRG